MKPKSLKRPFTWKQRKPLLQNRVLYVPEYYDKHAEWEMPGFDHPDFFGNSNEVFIEYCSGNGLWIATQAQENPHVNWVAVEHDFDRVRRVWAKINNHHLSNLIVVSGEALIFTRYYLADSSISRIYMNFPDPWPKRKHAKNRLVQRPFVEEITRILKKSAQAVFVTDDATYMQQISSEMRSHPSWNSSYPEPFFITDWPEYGNSSFDALWRKKGKIIHYLQFEKQS